MRWDFRPAILSAALLCGACDQLGPHEAVSAPPQATPVPDLRPFVGQTYAAFVSQPGMERYAPDALGLGGEEEARLVQAMAAPLPAQLAAGGGAEALVFAGCAVGGCVEARAVFAVDLANGAVFIGVRDQAGGRALTPNDKLEALLRVTSPTRRWEDAAPPGPEATLP
jgi:hypothetical protein